MLDQREKRRLAIKLLRDAADVLQANGPEPVKLVNVVFDLLDEMERREIERRHRPPAA